MFVEFVVCATKRGEIKIAGNEGVSSGSEYSAIVDAPTVYTSIVKKQKDKSVYGCKFFYFGMAFRK